MHLFLYTQWTTQGLVGIYAAVLAKSQDLAEGEEIRGIHQQSLEICGLLDLLINLTLG